MTIMSALAMSADIDDVTGRLGVTLTLLLTAVAFKLILADKLPIVSYFTRLDHYLMLSMGILMAASGLCVLPYTVVFHAGDNVSGGGIDTAGANRLNRACGLLIVSSVLLGTLWWILAASRRRSRQHGTNKSIMRKAGQNFHYFAFAETPFLEETDL